MIISEYGWNHVGVIIPFILLGITIIVEIIFAILKKERIAIVLFFPLFILGIFCLTSSLSATTTTINGVKIEYKQIDNGEYQAIDKQGNVYTITQQEWNDIFTG